MRETARDASECLARFVRYVLGRNCAAKMLIWKEGGKSRAMRQRCQVPWPQPLESRLTCAQNSRVIGVSGPPSTSYPLSTRGDMVSM
jgi:hypothetical protein